jgi:hypothetical protein
VVHDDQHGYLLEKALDAGRLYFKSPSDMSDGGREASMFWCSKTIRLLRVPAGVALAVLVLAADEASAYVIFLKDGSRIEAKEKPTAQGSKWVFVISSGNRQSILASEVDEKKTEEFNKLGLGDSYLLSEEKEKTIQQGSARKPTLSEFIKDNKKSDMRGIPGAGGEPSQKSAGTAPAAARKAVPAPASLGSAVQVDSVISEAFTRALEGAGVRGARVTPAGAGLRVQAITENEQQVFAAIGAAARGLKESRASGRSVDKVELFLASATGENAGKFKISPEDAEALLNGKVSAAKYFVANVIF